MTPLIDYIEAAKKPIRKSRKRDHLAEKLRDEQIENAKWLQKWRMSSLN